MNLMLIHPEELRMPGGTCHAATQEPTNPIAELSGRRYDHLLEVLKIDQRDGRCKIGMIDGLTGMGECLEIDREAKKIRLRVEFSNEPPPPLPLTLVAALPRPKTFRKVLHAAVSMGVKNLWFFGSFKVDKSYWQSPLISEAAWREESILALEQAGDTVLPHLEFRRLFKPFVEDELPGIAAGSRFLVAHPTGAEPCPTGLDEPATLCIGPEGGFTDYEVGLLVKAGAQCITLGPRILRTEVALPALLSCLYA